jgi:FkbH-like protein
MMEAVNKANLESMPALRLAVLRNVMLEALEPVLQYHGLRAGLHVQAKFGEYDNIFQEAVGGRADLLNQNTDCVLIFPTLETLSPELSRRFPTLAPEALKAEIQRVEQFSRSILEGVRQQTQALILWHGFELPPHPALGTWDAQVEVGQANVVRRLNESLRAACSLTPNASFVDLSLIAARIGWEQYFDVRFWHMGRAPYTLRALEEIGAEDFKFLRALKGKNKKCLVLDCDNTLWGGIIGEDGLEGVKLGQTHPGSYFADFQQVAVNLFHRGVIIALCSKNNEADVWEVFDMHPDMVLKREHIAAWRINWKDKASNLRQLALDLNISLDSLVFLDDSEFEVNLVRQELPEVEAVLLPKANPALYATMLAGSGWFDTLTLSEEDKKRGAMYRADAGRKQLAVASTDMETYYRSLEMEVEIALADNFSIPRIAQQTQKTNQFNLTTRRYSEADIQAFVQSNTSDVACLRLRDKFGDMGIVGTCILRYEDSLAIFDTMLMSCRVLGRGVEDVFLRKMLDLAILRNCTSARGEYYATKKNSQVEDFFAKQGFSESVSVNFDCAPDRVFTIDLHSELPPLPDYYKKISCTF